MAKLNKNYNNYFGIHKLILILVYNRKLFKVQSPMHTESPWHVHQRLETYLDLLQSSNLRLKTLSLQIIEENLTILRKI